MTPEHEYVAALPLMLFLWHGAVELEIYPHPKTGQFFIFPEEGVLQGFAFVVLATHSKHMVGMRAAALPTA